MPPQPSGSPNLLGKDVDLFEMDMSSVPGLFNIIQNQLSGEMKTFGDDFVPPGLLDPNYVPPDQGPFLLAFSIATICFAGLIVALRFYARSKRTGRSGLGVDDYMMILALVLTAGYTTVNCLGIKYGCLGKHVYDCSVNEVTALLKTFYAQSPIYLAAGAAIKISILLFYRRLVGPINVKIEWSIRILIIFVTLYTVSGIFALAFMCTPASSYYDLTKLHGGDCPTDKQLMLRYRSILGMHVALDFIILLLPMKVVWDLRLPWKQKAGLVILFGTGTGACAASIVRLVYFPVINNNIDVTRNGVILCFWGQLEATAAMVAASVPSLKSLFMPAKSKRKSTPVKNMFSSISTTVFSARFGIHRDKDGDGGTKNSNMTVSTAGEDAFARDLERGPEMSSPEVGFGEMIQYDTKGGMIVMQTESEVLPELPSFAAYVEGNLSEEQGLGLSGTTTGIDPSIGYLYYDQGRISPLSDRAEGGASPDFATTAGADPVSLSENHRSSSSAQYAPPALSPVYLEPAEPRSASPVSFLSVSSTDSVDSPSASRASISTTFSRYPDVQSQLRLQTGSSSAPPMPLPKDSPYLEQQANFAASSPSIQPYRARSPSVQTPNLTLTPTSTWAPDSSWSTLPSNYTMPSNTHRGIISAPPPPRQPPPTSPVSHMMPSRRRGVSEPGLCWAQQPFRVPRKPVPEEDR